MQNALPCPLEQIMLTPQELENLAAKICEKGLAAPVIFCLEMSKPLSTLAFNLLNLSFPVFSPLLGYDSSRKLSALVGDRQALEALIQLIETRQQGTHGI